MANPAIEIHSNVATSDSVAKVNMKLEVVVIPVSDIDRAKEFYKKLGWRLDVTPPSVVQFTPPGSWCSVQFGTTLTTAAPGSAKSYLIVPDIVAARNQLVAAGIEVSEFFHFGPEGKGSGLDPERRSYRSRASFKDPDGNAWLLQEVTSRLPGRVDSGVTSFSSASDLASALRRAAAAHGQHEKRIGGADSNWPDWYAEYMVREQNGEELPQ
ncbi:MAG: VOC family protein [Candidatus Sulfotelmatobacter sp.]|jgi:catechol 2,3-dioxygenase-like lactoylglutathione lyase family enzyme